MSKNISTYFLDILNKLLEFFTFMMMVIVGSYAFLVFKIFAHLLVRINKMRNMMNVMGRLRRVILVSLGKANRITVFNITCTSSNLPTRIILMMKLK